MPGTVLGTKSTEVNKTNKIFLERTDKEMIQLVVSSIKKIKHSNLMETCKVNAGVLRTGG